MQSAYVLFVGDVVAGGGHAVVAVGGPLDGVAAEVLLLVQRGLAGHIPELQGALHLTLWVSRADNAYAETRD